MGASQLVSQEMVSGAHLSLERGLVGLVHYALPQPLQQPFRPRVEVNELLRVAGPQRDG